MKVNFNKSFKDFRGKDLGINMADEVGKILFNLSTADKAPLSADEKYMAYKVCSRICSDGEVELNANEAAFVVKMCGEYMTAGAYGQVRELIEN